MLLEQETTVMAEGHEAPLTPEIILHASLLNKGTAFTEEERDEFGLHGLIPPVVSTIEEQVSRAYKNFHGKASDLEKYLFLTDMQNRNEVLFYRFAAEHPEEVLPCIYTPTVGTASIQFSNIYAENRGLFLSYPLRDQLDEILSRVRKDIEVIVVTDGSRILGLGDLGIGGMAIPVGKLSLYTLFGGIHPGKTLPIVLDVGTNNTDLLEDPLYLGWKHPRITGKDYDAFIDSFVKAIKRHLPHVLLQWEDFAKPNASTLLERYQDKICSFNDDIQGTAAVTLAAILSALKVTGGRLEDQRFAIYGAGSAGIGIADIVIHKLKTLGIEEEEAKKVFYFFNRKGLIHTGIGISDPMQVPFARPKEEVAGWKTKHADQITLLDAIEHIKPTILIGVSGQGGCFTEEIVTCMAAHTPRPIIFPLSNPTSLAEAVPADLFKWTLGRAIISTGSPFKPVEFEGYTYEIGQCNNVYIYPGVGLGIITSKSKAVTPEMFIKAAEILSAHSPMLEDPRKALFPRIRQLRAVSREIAIAIAKMAIEEGLARVEIDSIEEAIDEQMWFPEYKPLRRRY